MIKRYIASIAVICMLFSFVSCRDGEQAINNEDDKPTEISMLFMEPGNAPYREDWLILKEIQERMNVKLNLQVVPGRDYNQKRAIVFASGDIPDIVVNTWPDQMTQYAIEGILLPVSDHLDKLPNLKRIIEEWDLEDTVKNISELDGKFYILPDFRKELSGTQCFGIREDIFKKHNIPIPETYDDLANALIQLKQIYPDILGFGDGYNGDFMLSFMAEAFNTNGGFSLPWGYSYHEETDEWYFAPTSNEYKEFLKYMNNLYNHGVFDPEVFTQDGKQCEQKILNDKYLVMPIDGPSAAKGITRKLHELGKTEAKVTAIYPLAGPTGLRKVKPSSRNQGGLAMPAKIAEREDFDKVMEFCNWLYYSEEAAILTRIGVEGVTYNIVDGEYVINPDIRTGANPNGTISTTTEYGYPIMGLMTLVPDLLPEKIKKVITDPEQYEFEKYIKENGMTTKDDPIVKMTPEQQERARLLITTLNDYSKQMMIKFIYGMESFDNWDKFVQECNNKGAQELLEIVRTAWKENRPK